MRVFRFLSLFFVLLVNVVPVQADTSPVSWFTINAKDQIVLRVDLFLVSTCPHCQHADAFFKQLLAKNDLLDVHYHLINEDKSALMLFNQYLQQQQVHDFSVPTIFFCNSRWVGFAQAQASGQSLIEGLSYCSQQIQKHQELNNTTIQALRQRANSYSIAATITKQAVQSRYTLLWLAVIAALNPCTMITVFLLFVLLHFQSQWKHRAVLMGVYLLLVGGLNYIQLEHWSLFFTLAECIRLPAVIFAVFALIWGIKLFKKSKFSFWCALFISGFLGVTVQIYQQACLPNFSMIFQQRQIAQSTLHPHSIVLTLLYNTIYSLSIGLIAGLLLIFSEISSMKRKQPYINRFCEVFVVMIGLILLLLPRVLSTFQGNFFIIITTFIIALLIRCFWDKKYQNEDRG